MLETKFLRTDRSSPEPNFMAGLAREIDALPRLIPRLNLVEIGMAPFEIAKVDFGIDARLEAVIDRTKCQHDEIHSREAGFIDPAQPFPEADIGPGRSPHLVAVLVNDPAAGKVEGDLLLAKENR